MKPAQHHGHTQGRHVMTLTMVPREFCVPEGTRVDLKRWPTHVKRAYKSKKLRIDRIFSSPLQRARRTAELAMPHSRVEADDDLMEWDYGTYEGRRTTEIEIDRPGWRLFRDGCPNGETLDSVDARADRVIGRIRSPGGNVLFFGHRDVLRILAVRWIGLAPIEGRHLLLATASLSVLGYDHDHDLTEPVIHAWNASVGDRGQETT